jgi:hypothetical protein
MSTDQIKALSSSSVMAFSESQIEALTGAQLNAMRTEASPIGLSGGDLDRLTSVQVQAIESRDIATLNTDSVKSLSTAFINALTTLQVEALKSDQIKVLTTKQIFAMTPGQVARIGYEDVDAVLDDIRRDVQPVLDYEQLVEIKRTVSSLYMDDKVKDYVLDVVAATRRPEDFKMKELKPLIQCGASPRASINLCLAARGNAFLAGRGYVTPQDVKDIAYEVLRHRILLSYEAEAEELNSDDIVRKVLESVPVP